MSGGSNSSLVRSITPAISLLYSGLEINRKYCTNWRTAWRREQQNGDSWGEGVLINGGGGTWGWFRGHAGSIHGLKMSVHHGAREQN